jgi:hypothetical protein
MVTDAADAQPNGACGVRYLVPADHVVTWNVNHLLQTTGLCGTAATYKPECIAIATRHRYKQEANAVSDIIIITPEPSLSVLHMSSCLNLFISTHLLLP